MNKTKSEMSICTNCEKVGHLFHQCKLPIISYGIIAFRRKKHEDGMEYLMIRRKDSFGYIDFIRGKYSFYNIERIKQCLDGMSIIEKERIRTEPFEVLWKELWGKDSLSQYKNEEVSSSKKFNLLRSGITINNKEYTLTQMINDSSTIWNEQEWEFPKGRRNYKEKDINCALREFHEETGYAKDTLKLVTNILPYEEIFLGSNHKAYKHKYYLAYLTSKNDILPNYQKAEVSKIEWKSIDKCIEDIRCNNLEKKLLILNINKVLEQYRLYS